VRTPYAGVGRVLSSAEVRDLRNELNVEDWNTLEANLIFTVQQREGTLRRLYNAVIATPLEGTELTAAMAETERVLRLSQGHPDTDR